MDDILMWDWVAENVSPLTRMGKALWRGCTGVKVTFSAENNSLLHRWAPACCVICRCLRRASGNTWAGAVSSPSRLPPCPTEWWSIYLVGQARSRSHLWHLPLVYHKYALHPHSLPALPLKSLESVQFSPSRPQPPQSWLPAVLLEPCHSLPQCIGSGPPPGRHPSATSWLGTLKFKTLQNLFLKWLLLLGWICSMTKGHELAGPLLISLVPSLTFSLHYPHGHLLIPWRWNLIPVLFPFWAFAQAVPEILPPLAPHNVIQICQMILLKEAVCTPPPLIHT